MYLGYLVDVPDKKGKITFRQKGNAKYVYYEYDRVYDPERKYEYSGLRVPPIRDRIPANRAMIPLCFQ